MLHRSSSSSQRRRTSRSVSPSPRRASLADMQRIPSQRPMLTPENYDRSPRHSLAPEPISRSARNSLIPEAGGRLTSRNSLVPDNTAYGSRLSLNPQDFNKSPRNSWAPDMSARSPRRSLVPESPAWNQSRNSLTADVNRSPRHSVANIQDSLRHPRKGDFTPSPRTSPRGSIGPELNVCSRGLDNPGRSPRGSIGPEIATSSRGIDNRSPRGSMGPEISISSSLNQTGRSPRGSITPSEGRTGRGSLVPSEVSEIQRISPRGSLTLTFQEPLVTERRSSEDTQPRGRTVSPYRASLSGGAGRSGNQYGINIPEGGSRRASSSVSQVSGDEQRRLCNEHSKYIDSGGGGLGIGLTTYGSVAYQLKDANMESSGTFDFICRAASIMNRTVLMTVFLACVSTLPLIMLIMGVQYIRDCPAEPHLPVYMVVGGTAGGAKVAWLLWSQLAARSPIVQTTSSTLSTPETIASLLLSLFLLVWFGLGNYWTLHICWPDYHPTLFEPNNWCHKTLYVFSLSHLIVLWVIAALFTIMAVVLAFCQALGCGWLGVGRYK